VDAAGNQADAAGSSVVRCSSCWIVVVDRRAVRVGASSTAAA